MKERYLLVRQINIPKNISFLNNLKGNQIKNFKISEHFDCMKEIENKYRPYIKDDLRHSFDANI